MEQQKEKITTQCKCGYEFLVPNADSCPKCGRKLRDLKIDLSFGATGSMAVSTEKAHSEEKKIVDKRIKVILIIILIGSPILGVIIAGPIGFVIGIILDVVAYVLGDYAEKRILEKTIERDHYH